MNSIYKKLLEIKKKVPYLKKNKKGYQYNYADPETVLGTINPLLNEAGIFLKTEVLSQEVKPVEVNDRNGKHLENLYLLKLKYTWIDAESGEKEEVLWESSGCNGEEKGLGSALTYSERYFMLKTFNIPTGEDDPNARQVEKKEVKKKIEQEESAKLDALSSLYEKACNYGAEIGEEKSFIEQKLGKKIDWNRVSLPIIKIISKNLDESCEKTIKV